MVGNIGHDWRYRPVAKSLSAGDSSNCEKDSGNQIKGHLKLQDVARCLQNKSPDIISVLNE